MRKTLAAGALVAALAIGGCGAQGAVQEAPVQETAPSQEASGYAEYDADSAFAFVREEHGIIGDMLDDLDPDGMTSAEAAEVRQMAESARRAGRAALDVTTDGCDPTVVKAHAMLEQCVAGYDAAADALVDAAVSLTAGGGHDLSAALDEYEERLGDATADLARWEGAVETAIG